MIRYGMEWYMIPYDMRYNMKRYDDGDGDGNGAETKKFHLLLVV